VKDFGDCEELTTDTRILLSEKQSRLCFVNNSKASVRKVKVDGCVIRDGLRCDWLIIGADQSEFFVELKGGDVHHGIKQLEASMHLRDTESSAPKLACLVNARMAKPARTRYLKSKETFKKKYNVTLKSFKPGTELSVD
jgi:hypothetical protein